MTPWEARKRQAKREAAQEVRDADVDREWGALARYLDAHPGRHAALLRHDDKWVIRVDAAIGFGHTPGEAAESVGHSLARVEQPTIPDRS